MTTTLPPSRSARCPASARHMPAARFEFTSESPAAQDVRVWRDDESGRCRVAFRAGGLGLVVDLEPHQADALAGAVLDEAPVPYELVDAEELAALAALPEPPLEWLDQHRSTLSVPSDEQVQAWTEANDHASDAEGW